MAAQVFFVTRVEFVELCDLLAARVVTRMHDPEGRERLPASLPDVRMD